MEQYLILAFGLLSCMPMYVYLSSSIHLSLNSHSLMTTMLLLCAQISCHRALSLTACRLHALRVKFCFSASLIYTQVALGSFNS